MGMFIAVVIAGDIYNSEDHNLEAQVRFVRAMYRLAEHRHCSIYGTR